MERPERFSCRAVAARVGLALAILAGLTHAGPVSGQQAEGEDEEPKPISREFGIKETSPRFTMHGFADVFASYERSETDAGVVSTENSFSLGELDLFVVSRLAENLSFLGEIVFEPEGGSVASEVERMFIKYTVSDAFWISMGRHHAPLGYWNETFHHGLILQPTVGRPHELNFEDHLGILPVHSVGIEMGGRWFRSAWGLEYTADIGNGRAIVPYEVQTVADANGNKAITLRLRATHEGKSEILFGPMVHAEIIPPNPADPARADSLQERIYGFHFVWSAPRFEILSEYFYMRHEDTVTGATYLDPSGYVIAYGKFGKWKPYAGYDRESIDPDDPYFAGYPSLTRILAGVRWDVVSFNALKLEYRHDDRPGIRTNAVIFQSAFTF